MKRLLIVLALLATPTVQAQTEVERAEAELVKAEITLFAAPINAEKELVSAAIKLGRAEAELAQAESALVLAQAGQPSDTTAATAEAARASTAADAASEDSPDVGEVISDAGKVIDDWQNVGWLAGLIALINLMMNMLRFKPINNWLTTLDYKWIKPLTAALLGAGLGGLSTYATGASAINSIVAGAMAGLSSVGFHELMDKTRKRTTMKAG